MPFVLSVTVTFVKRFHRTARVGLDAPALGDPVPSRLPVREAALEAVLGRLSLPRYDPGVGRLRGHAVTDDVKPWRDGGAHQMRPGYRA